jgi:hypothetical protein
MTRGAGTRVRRVMRISLSGGVRWIYGVEDISDVGVTGGFISE